ncbi:hypothetical protein PYCC9005_005620 [Savitreella phatthalungensis]
MTGKITLYFDCVSPYAFFGLHTLELLRERWGIDAEYKPISLGIVMKESGNKPPITVPAKGRHLDGDVRRVVDLLGLGEFKRPSNFPFNSIKAQKVLCAVKANCSPKDFVNVCRAFSRAAWTLDVPDMTADSALVDAAATVIPRDQAQKLVEQGQADQKYKAAMIANTKEVLESGGFGLPWWKVEAEGKQPEYFFGHDRYEYIAHALGKEWPGFINVARQQAHI